MSWAGTSTVSLRANDHLIVDDNALISVSGNQDVLTIPYGADNVEIEGGRWSDSVNVYHSVIHDYANRASIHNLQLIDHRGSVPDAGLGIRVEGTSGPIEGTRIYNIDANTSFIAIGLSTAVHDTTIDNVFIHDGGECFDFNGDAAPTVNTTVSNSTCKNTYGNNYIESAQQTTITNSHFINCGRDKVNCWYSHIGGKARPYRTTFSNNDFLGGPGSHIYIFGVSTDVAITGNRFELAGMEAIRIDPSAGGTNQYITIAGNQFKDNGASAPPASSTLGAIGIHSSGGAQGVNNLLVVGNGFYSTVGTQKYAITGDSGKAPFQVEWFSNEVIGMAKPFNFGVGCNSCTIGPYADGTGAALVGSDLAPDAYNRFDLGRSYAGEYWRDLFISGAIKTPSATLTLPGASGTLGLTSQLPRVGTPPTSSAACTPPQLEYDSAYLYVCTAPNTWRRLATTPF